MMQHSILDRLYIVFLIIMIVSFAVVIVIISTATRRTLIDEKSKSLSTSVAIVASQTVGSYVAGEIDRKHLTSRLEYYSTILSADLWYVNEDGDIIAMTEGSLGASKRYSAISVAGSAEKSTGTDVVGYSDSLAIPDNIYTINPNYRLDTSSSDIGNFYGIYNSNVITVNVPLEFSYSKGNDTHTIPVGAIICHSSAEDITGVLNNIYGYIYVPCLIIIIISFSLLGLISNRVIRPVQKLSAVAKDYSMGNFDVKTGIDSQDEIGQLAESMEYMASELSKLEEYRHEFISNISHDFRSPLTSIKGYVEAMLDGTIPPDKSDRYLKIVLDETKRLTKLTSGLLELNNLDIYGPYLKLESFDLTDIINPMLGTFEIKCISKNIAIYFNNHANDTVVTADKTKIEQVIYNLIDNAIKFTPEGKKIFIVTEDIGPKLKVTVRDEGIGMNENTAKQIFVRFYKDDLSRGKDKQGTGLGLAIAKEIMKAHNEDITVESEPGKGSSFTFTLTKTSSAPKADE